MKFKRVSLFLLILGFVAITPSASSDIAPPPDPIEENAKNNAHTIIALLKKIHTAPPKLSATQIQENKNTYKELGTWLNLEDMAQTSLGKYATKQNARDKQQLQKILEDLIVNFVYPKSVDFLKQDSVSIQSAQKNTTGRVIVSTRVVPKGQDPVEMNYEFTESSAGLKIADLVIEGESIMQTYRLQFEKTIREKGFNHLIAQLRKKIQTAQKKK